MKNPISKIPEIRDNGKFIICYPVDESQMVSNAGDADVYHYKGKKYEIITWNDRAEEHKSGEETISEIEL